MSKIVCHMEKFKASDCGGIKAEDFRLSDKINKKNPDLDYSKIGKNLIVYHSMDDNSKVIIQGKRYHSINFDDYDWQHKMKDRISELQLGKKVRKDAVTCCSFIIGSDQEFFEEKDLQGKFDFFAESYEFFGERYGYENIVGASIHMDEGGAPHMHLRIVPVTKEGRLSAKTLFNRQELMKIQDELPKRLKGKGFQIERGRNSSKEGKIRHLSEVDYKLKKREEELDILEKRIKKNADLTSNNVAYLFELLRRAQEEYEDIKKRYAELSRNMADMPQFAPIRDSKQSLEESLPKLKTVVNEAIMKAEEVCEVQNELLEDTQQLIRRRRRGR